MAAETLVGTRAAADFPVYKPMGAGALAVAYGSYAVAANVEDGDIFKLCKLPAGAIIVGGQFWASDMDTGIAALDIDIGWAANGGSATVDSASAAGLVNSGVLSGDVVLDLIPAGANFRPFNMSAGAIGPFTNETVIQAEANVAAATFAAGTIFVRVDYIVP
ncbi:hypothetical protein [Phenylobacterium sp.]|uniref:hypothetical protein n=1 Tax=Phenylobacterium sp. TaxID=1871053 RepID=UPI002730729D|nr:hypothetical protein [Phenylobacterium sp.]MDP1873641.1 hypothetical protein [Phenylobacterium sp.]